MFKTQIPTCSRCVAEKVRSQVSSTIESTGNMFFFKVYNCICERLQVNFKFHFNTYRQSCSIFVFLLSCKLMRCIEIDHFDQLMIPLLMFP